MILLAVAALASSCHVTRPPTILPELTDAVICMRFRGLHGSVEVRLSRNGVANARLVRSDRVLAETSMAVSDRGFRVADIDLLAVDLARVVKKRY